MEKTEILARINHIAADLFNSPQLILKTDTVASDVDGWDSLTHIALLMEVEKTFKVRFKSSEVSSFSDVGQLVDKVQTRLKA